MRGHFGNHAVLAAVSILMVAISFICLFTFLHFHVPAFACGIFFICGIMVPSLLIWTFGHRLIWPWSPRRFLVFLACFVFVLASVAFLAPIIERGACVYIFLASCVVCIVAPAFVLWQMISFVCIVAMRPPTGMRIWAEGSGICGLMLVIVFVHLHSFFSIGATNFDLDLTIAMQFCERTVIPRLEKYHRAKGAYPKRIDEILGRNEPLPWILRTKWSWMYGTNDDAFWIRFIDPRGLWGPSWVWTSGKPTWVKDDD